MTPLVTVMEHDKLLSWPQKDPEKPLRKRDRTYVLPLAEALEREYRTDAHMTAYRSTVPHRINSAAVERGIDIVLDFLIFDIDGEKHQASEAWRRDVRERVQHLNSDHRGLFFYETRGGCRVLYRLPEPYLICEQADAQRWGRDYHVLAAHLRRVYGIEADTSCCDWTRLYRLPRATRDGGGGGPENRPTWGDPHNIGTLTVRPTSEDIEMAKRTGRRVISARRYQRMQSTGDGFGLFWYLLDARGDVGSAVERASGSGWIALCPNRNQHRTDETRDKTVVYPPLGATDTLGAIHCKRGSCQHFRQREWLNFFSEDEIARAEQRMKARAA